MWGLEYALLFGVPNNKLELIDGRSRLAFPFLDREQAEAHFEDWITTLCRWKGVSERPPAQAGRLGDKVEAAGFVVELARRPIELRIPFDIDTFLTSDRYFWRRDLWDGQPAGRETGWDNAFVHGDVRMILWGLLHDWCKKHGGVHSSRVDVALSESVDVAPDVFYYRNYSRALLKEDDYFRGAPDLVVEMLSAATRAIDRGPRKEIYRRAGVGHLWLLDPEVETVELYELNATAYEPRALLRAGDEFRPALFPGETVKVDDLFKHQWKRHADWPPPREDPELIPAWLFSAEQALGLEHLFLLGHPGRRWEIWNNRTPCVLPFGSVEEARLRFAQFVEEACRWEQMPVPKPSLIEREVEQVEVGRFRLTRQGRRVNLDVAVDGRKYQELLRMYSRREAWDWGEE